MAWSIALNILLIFMMGAGIFYAWRLQGMINGLSKNREDMARFLAEFTGSITRAEQAIRALQDTAQDTGVEVDRQIARGVALRDELTFLVDAADRIATRLTDSTGEAQKQSRAARDATPEVDTKDVQPKKEAAKPDMRHGQTKAYEQAAVPVRAEEKTMPAWAKRIDNDVVVINKAPDIAADKTVKPLNRPPREQPRSQAERDLLHALEKMQ